MYLQEEIEKYLKYSTDDFLLDDFFIRSIRHSDEHAALFWSNFLDSNPPNVQQYIQAKDFILTICDSKSLTVAMPDAEQDDFFAKIMDINKSNLKRKKAISRYMIAAATTVAASIAIVVSLHFFRNSNSPSDPGVDLVYYVQQGQDSIDFNSQNIRLKLSEDRTITSNQYDQEYLYSAENIVIAGEEISKEESSEFNQLMVPYGKRSRLTLSDGTKIWVNAGTIVTYPVEFGKKSREIYVLGEVFLDVTHDPNRPFIVKTGKFDVQVLGTKFNVSSYKDEEESVVLVSGSVKVSLTGSDKEAILRPNEIFKVGEGKEMIEQTDIEFYTSWVDEIYIFRDEQMDVLMKRLSKYYGKTIKCSPAVGLIKCSGKLNIADSFDSILDTLSKITGMKYKVSGNHYDIY